MRLRHLSLILLSLCILSLGFLLAACGTDDTGDEVQDAQQRTATSTPGVAPGQLIPCPAIGIRCIEGYTLKPLPRCRQICVPDASAPDCLTDFDCPAIYCITSPCPTYQCMGRQCVLKDPVETPTGGTCGNVTCGAGTYCCNASCGICAPLDSFCIQIACDSFGTTTSRAKPQLN